MSKRTKAAKEAETATIEIVSPFHELPPALVQKYGVEPVKVAETQFFTIFSLTIPRHTSTKDFRILDPFISTQDIDAYAWSRAIKVTLRRPELHPLLQDEEHS